MFKMLVNVVKNTATMNITKLECLGRILIPLLFCIGVLCSCSTIKYLPAETITQVNVVDSIAWHDSTVFHKLYKEVYKDYTGLLDTLRLEDSYSTAFAAVDTSAMKLVGAISTKDTEVPVKIKWKEKIIYRDSIKVVQKPYPVEVIKEVKKVPNFYKFCLWWFIGTVALLGFRIFIFFYLKK